MQSQHDNQASGIAREQSVLAMLRALAPNRPLSQGETLRIAELQADHLLRHFQIETASIHEIVSELRTTNAVTGKSRSAYTLRSCWRGLRCARLGYCPSRALILSHSNP